MTLTEHLPQKRYEKKLFEMNVEAIFEKPKEGRAGVSFEMDPTSVIVDFFAVLEQLNG
jgi:hypothetical protein